MSEPMDFEISSSLVVTSSRQTKPRGKFQWPGGDSIKQSFSLPDTIMYYIAKNPLSAKGYLKLVQSCKYFFEAEPILVAAQIRRDSKICSKRIDGCISDLMTHGKCCIDLDIKKCLPQMWITEELTLCNISDINFTSLLCKKLYQSDIKWLEFRGKTVLLDDFKVLTASLSHLTVQNVKIIDNDGSILSIDEILEYVPKLKKFDFHFVNDESTSSLNSITKLNDLTHLERVALNIPELYSIQDVSNFIKAHKDMIIWLEFNDTISEDYKNQLDAVIDYIIESEIPSQIIEYNDQDQEKWSIMDDRWDGDD